MNAISDFDVTWSYGSSALRKISAEYERLRLRTNGAILFSDWPWLQAAANHLVPSSGREIATLEIRRCRELVACIPFTRGREFIHGLPAQTLRLLGYPLADRVAIVMDPAEPGLSDSIVAAIVDSRAAIADVAILGELPRLNGQSDDLAHAATMRDQRFFRRHCSRAPVLDIVGREALKASYSRALRTRLARARRKINHFKSIRFERIRPRPDEVPKLLSMIAAVEHESWKGQARKGIFSTAVRREFFTEISTARAAAGQLEISLLWLDHELVTYFYGFREHETYYDYNSAQTEVLCCRANSLGRNAPVGAGVWPQENRRFSRQPQQGPSS
jgi:CelD/BcsL family acetyltransferase involved in cellulose biosynthesis